MRLFTVLGLALAGLAFANDSVLEDDTGVEYLQKSPAFSDSVYANASIYAANLIDLHGRDGLGLFGESPLTKRQRTCPGQAFCGAGCMPIGNSCCTTYHCPSG
jgi:hypothetical protein